MRHLSRLRRRLDDHAGECPIALPTHWGTEPIFRTNDGSNCDTLDVSTIAARRAACSLLLNKGLIRIAMAVPPNAEFTVSAVDNPYGCNSTTTLSVYRRPLPSTNLSFLTTVMWDGRESFPGTRNLLK